MDSVIGIVGNVNKGIEVKFTGMSQTEGSQVPVFVTLNEFHSLLDQKLIEVRALKIRPNVIDGLSKYYKTQHPDTTTFEASATTK